MDTKIGSLTLGALGTGDFVPVARGSSNFRIPLQSGISGVASSVANALLLSYTGATSLTTLGTISVGTWNGTPITVPYGGTNITSFTAGDIMYASAGTTLSKLGIGSSGQVMMVSGGLPQWVNFTGATSINTLGTIGVGTWNGTAVGVVYGGTNLTSYASGDILYASNATTLAKLAAGTSGQVLTMGSAYPAWAASVGGGSGLSDPGSNGIVKRTALNTTTVATQGTDYYAPAGTDVAVADGGTNISSYASGDLLYASNSTTLAKLAAGSSGQYLKMGAAYPTWASGTSSLTLTALGSTTSLASNFLYTGTITGRTVTLPSATNQDVIVYRGVAADNTTITWPSNSVLQVGASGYATGTYFPSGSNVEFSLAYASPYWFLVDSSAPTGAYYQAGGTDVAVADGGTNISSYASGDILYASSSTVLSKLAAGTSGQVLTMGSAYPAWAASVGGGTGLSDPGSNGIVKRTALNTTTVATEGTDYYAPGGTDVAVADGGTNISSYTSGDLLYASSSTVLSKLAAGVSGQFLKMGAAYPTWGSGAAYLTISNLGSNTGLLSNYLYTGTITGRTISLPSATNQDVIVYRGIAASDTTITWPSNSVLQVGGSGYVSSTNFTSGSNVEFALAYVSPYWFLADSAAPTQTYYYQSGTDVAVADGGTNISSYSTGDLLYASSPSVLSKLGIGTSTQYLGVISGVPSWRTGNLSELTGVVGVANGGTNISSYASGDLLYATNATTLAKLAAGTSGQVLSMGAAYPQWVTNTGAGASGLVDPGSNGIVKRTSLNVTAVAVQGTDYYAPGGTDIAVADGGTNISSYASGDILYASSATVLSKLTAGNSGQILTMGSAYPQWTSGSITGGAGTAGGSSGQLQYNNAGTFGGMTDSLVSGRTLYISGMQITGSVQIPALYGSDGATRLNVGYTGLITGTTALATGITLLASTTLTASGTYMLYGQAYLRYNATTYAGNQTATIKLRRTNNTATDIPNATTSPTMRIVTTVTDSIGTFPTNHVIYQSTTTGDIIGIYGNVSAAPAAGSVDASEASIFALRLWE